MSDQPEQPPKRGRGRPRKSEILLPRIPPLQAGPDPQGSPLALEPATLPAQPVPLPATPPDDPYAVPNAVIQITKGDHRGVLCQVGEFDVDVVHCYMLRPHGEKEFISVKHEDYTYVSPPIRGMVAWKYVKPATESTPDWHEPAA